MKAFSREELFDAHHGEGASSKHLLTIYSFIVGLQAKVIADIGIGASTRTCLAAAAVTRGQVHSCDMDEKRYKKFERELTPNWTFCCVSSTEFISQLPSPIDFVMHDGSHEYDVVTDDLRRIVPKMRRFGIICVHDTQQPRYRLLDAIEDIRKELPLSHVPMPYGCGLSILRIEESDNDAISPAGMTKASRIVTKPQAIGTLVDERRGSSG